MIKYLKTFFYPDALIYTYNLSKEEVLSKIEDILKRKVTFFGDSDMKGSFLNEDTFRINIVSMANTNGVKYSSTLVGQVLESQNGTTCIKLKAKPSFALYSLFFVTIILGIGYLYKSIKTGSSSFLFWSLAMLIGGPFLSIGISNVAITSILERYKMYIHKELIGGNTPANKDLTSGGLK